MFIKTGMIKILYGFSYGSLHFPEIDADADSVQFPASNKDLSGPVMSMHLGAVAWIALQGMGSGKFGYYRNFENPRH